MTEIEKLNELLNHSEKQGERIKRLGEAIDKEIAKSQMNEAVKKALKECILAQATEQSQTPLLGIYGLHSLNKKPEATITLSNGLRIKADAFDV